jgi:hypothetical protein
VHAEFTHAYVKNQGQLYYLVHNVAKTFNKTSISYWINSGNFFPISAMCFSLVPSEYTPVYTLISPKEKQSPTDMNESMWDSLIKHTLDIFARIHICTVMQHFKVLTLSNEELNKYRVM